MANGAQKFFIDERENMLTLESAASLLGISTATVRNWVKCGYLRTINEKAANFFHLNDIESIKSEISNGSFAKLNKRANKSKADRTFVPEEYLQDQTGLENLNKIVDFVQGNNVDLSTALLLLALNLLTKENLMSSITIEDVAYRKEPPISNTQIREEIKLWVAETKLEDSLPMPRRQSKVEIQKKYLFLLDSSLPKHRDVLGFIYQSLLFEGKKSQSGSYYTPSDIVDEISNEYVKRDSKVLDPCCGTGQFLLAFADIIENPANIYGVDVDEIAVRIARLNLLIKYKHKEFAPNIFCKNTLFDFGHYDLFSSNDENIRKPCFSLRSKLRDFDVVATNPPWGLHFFKQEKAKLINAYPQISSFESFSYFLKRSIDFLKDGGKLSFILPESVLNVKAHRDIREFLLSNSSIAKIVYFDRVFKNVFTPVIRMDLEKDKKNAEVEICKENQTYKIDQSRWRRNPDYIFDIHASNFDAELIEKIYSAPHTTLENQADWALGIVTGNNSRFIISTAQKGYEEIYKGKDVNRFVLKAPSSYIQFSPEKFQQVAPEEKYRAREKLIYKFISKNLVFAYDNKQKLTLNSANIVIPKIADYPVKVIAALFNSSLYQFIFQKKFSSIKVLRSHIQNLPLPLWDKNVFDEIIKLVGNVINEEDNFFALDDYIMDRFSLSEKEKDCINEFNK